MNSYQCLIQAIRREHGKAIPRGELVIDRGFAREFINWRSCPGSADALSDTDLLLACSRLLKLDLVCIPSGKSMAGESILSPSAIDIPQIADEGLFVFWLVDGAFQSAMADRGMMALMTAMARFPGNVGKELEQRSQTVMATIARGMATPPHGVIIADDIAYGQGTYMSPVFVQRYLLPVWQAQVKAAHDLGVPAFFHSDGNINAVLPHLLAAGFDGLQGIEPAAGMVIESIKAEYGKRLCLMGNIDPALLCGPDPPAPAASKRDDLQRTVNQLMALGGRGGVIFGTCSGLHTGMWPKRVNHMYELAAEHYPAAPALPS